MDLGIRGRVALVAAASKGLGFASARRLAIEGARVSICSRDADACADAVRRLRGETGAQVYGLAADVLDAAQTAHWVRESEERIGRAEILVANGPGPEPGAFMDLDDDHWRRACDAVLVNLARQMRLVIPSMVRGGWGRIVLINSFTARQPSTNLTLSNAVRAGVLGLAKTVSVEVAGQGLTVNTVLPGPAGTERFLELLRANADRFGISMEEAGDHMTSDAPIKRLASPDEVGAAVAFLCSEPAGFVTGTAFPVDGGAIRAT